MKAIFIYTYKPVCQHVYLRHENITNNIFLSESSDCKIKLQKSIRPKAPEKSK